MIDAGDAILLGGKREAPTEPSPDVENKKPKKEETKDANMEAIKGTLAAINQTLIEPPQIDLSLDKKTWTSEFPLEQLRQGREREVYNLVLFDAFDAVWEVPRGADLYDMVWIEEWRGEDVRSRLCVRQFKSAEVRDDVFAGTPDTFFIRVELSLASRDESHGIMIIDISVAFMHARLGDEEEIYVRVPKDIKGSPFWKLKAAVNGTRKASQYWQDFSAEQMGGMGFDRNDVNPCIYHRDDDRLQAEQHGDDFLIEGNRSSLLSLAEEFKRRFLVKKIEIISPHPEDQTK